MNILSFTTGKFKLESGSNSCCFCRQFCFEICTVKNLDTTRELLWKVVVHKMMQNFFEARAKEELCQDLQPQRWVEHLELAFALFWHPRWQLFLLSCISWHESKLFICSTWQKGIWQNNFQLPYSPPMYSNSLLYFLYFCVFNSKKCSQQKMVLPSF